MSVPKQPLYREAALRKLTSPEDLDYLLKVTNVQAWVLLAALGLVLLAAFAWGAWGRMTTTVDVSGIVVTGEQTGEEFESLDVLTFVTLGDAQQVRPGQSAHVLPFGVSRDAHGYLQGTVESVSAAAASRAQLVAALGSSALVDSFVSAERLYAVRVALNRTPTGDYAWTASAAPPDILSSAQPVSLSIVVREDTPISRLFAQPQT